MNAYIYIYIYIYIFIIIISQFSSFQSIYFHTSIHDSGLLLVFEVVAITHVPDGDDQKIGVGWGFHYVFDLNQKLLDHSSSAPAPTQM